MRAHPTAARTRRPAHLRRRGGGGGGGGGGDGGGHLGSAHGLWAVHRMQPVRCAGSRLSAGHACLRRHRLQELAVHLRDLQGGG